LSAEGQLEHPCDVNNSSTAVPLPAESAAALIGTSFLCLLFTPKHETKNIAANMSSE
jgi:hypothetical protein